MGRIGIALVFTAISVAMLPVSSARAEISGEKEALREDFTRAYQRISQLGKAENKSGLMQMADDISRDWKPRNVKRYGDLTLRLCQVLRSALRLENIPFADIRLIAQRAVDTYSPNAQDNISPDTHYRLVMYIQAHLTYPKGDMTDEEWEAKRKTETARWMVAWDHMEGAIDPKWNPDEVLHAEIMPPVETGCSAGVPPAGVSPDSIDDPALRLLYEKAIEENNAKITHNTEQSRLRMLKEQFANSLARYFGGTYSVPPYNDSELEGFLTHHVKEAEVRSAILRTVAENKSKAETAQE